MSAHHLDLHRVARAMNDPDAIIRQVPTEDSYEMVSCSWGQAAEAFGLWIIGSAIMGAVLFAFITSN